MPSGTTPSHGDIEFIDTPPTGGTHFPTRPSQKPVKPKAKDPHKRDMTYEEKRMLGNNLQSLPTEQLGCVVRILEKRNPVRNVDNEIDIDLDSLDIETLWEIDRFVTNYNKCMSKYKRIECANQARVAAAKTVFASVTMRRDSMTMPCRTRPRHGNKDTAHSVSASDPSKRDMTYEEKHKLRTNLQSLPLGKKLDAVVQIVNRRNNDEIEVDIDIDSVDSDTLWELDRFVIDYKIKAELTSRVAAGTNPAQPATEDPPVGGDINAALARVKFSDYANPSSSSSSSISSHPGSSSTDVRQDVLMFDGKEER